MDKMEYGRIPYVEQPVSRIFLGTASDPMLAGENCDALFDAAVAAGINAFDSARVYQQSENVLGDWMARRGNREKLVVLTKGGHFDPDTGRRRLNPTEIKADLEESLGRLQTGYVDIYLLHRDDPDVPVAVIMEVLNELHAAGKIRAFGGSNWTHKRIEAANRYAVEKGLVPMAASSPNFGLADQIQDPWGGGAVSISGPQNAAARRWYGANGMPVIAYSSLGRGLFSGRLDSGRPEKAAGGLDEFAMKGYFSEGNFERLRRVEQLAGEKGCAVPQLAMAWLFCQPMETYAVLGTVNPKRIEETLPALHIKLTPQELAWLDLREDEG